MIVTLTADGALTLDQPENFRAFHIAAPFDAITQDRFAAAGLRLDGDHGWVPIHWLESAGAEQGPAWREDLCSMLAVARKHGWVDDNAAAIRGHIVVM